MATPRRGKGPRRAMIKISVDGERPPFLSERILHICGADIYRGKDGTMTIIMPSHSTYLGDTTPGDCRFSVSERNGTGIHGGVFTFNAYEFTNKDGYLSDRKQT